MGHLAELLQPTDIHLDIELRDRAALFQYIAQHFAQAYQLEAEAIVSGLNEREALCSTGLGQGVAIPHTRLKGIKQPYAVFIRLASPMGFAAPDDQPVDLIYALLVPQKASEIHLEILAEIAMSFHERQLRRELLAATSPARVCALFADHDSLAEQ